MKIRESKFKFVKRANMWVKTTLLDIVRKKSKKTGGEVLSDKFLQEWSNEPTNTKSAELKEEDILRK